MSIIVNEGRYGGSVALPTDFFFVRITQISYVRIFFCFHSEDGRSVGNPPPSPPYFTSAPRKINQMGIMYDPSGCGSLALPPFPSPREFMTTFLPVGGPAAPQTPLLPRGASPPGPPALNFSVHEFHFSSINGLFHKNWPSGVS